MYGGLHVKLLFILIVVLMFTGQFLKDSADFSTVTFSVFPSATELVDEPLPADWTMEADGSENGKGTVDTSSTGSGPDGQSHPGGLLPELERLAGRTMESELRHCSAEHLVQIHDRLGNMMKHVVAELHTRLCQTRGEPGK